MTLYNSEKPLYPERASAPKTKYVSCARTIMQKGFREREVMYKGNNKEPHGSRSTEKAGFVLQ